MYYMFAYCSNLTNVSALANWNTSNVTTMQGMFYGKIFQNMLKLSIITTMYEMFCYCSSLSIFFSNSLLSIITTMYEMFRNCSNLSNITALANWNTSNVTTMYCMFRNCSNLTTLDISGWDTSKVSNNDNFLYSCSKR